MARFFGPVGFTSGPVEGPPGVFKQPIVERSYYGDVVTNIGRNQETQQVTDDVLAAPSISIVGDPYASENYLAIRYVGYMGTLWKVMSVDAQSPRMILRLGGVYNGPTA